MRDASELGSTLAFRCNYSDFGGSVCLPLKAFRHHSPAFRLIARIAAPGILDILSAKQVSRPYDTGKHSRS